jgi:5-methylcytosine-specific restriction endonuclease McrA
VKLQSLKPRVKQAPSRSPKGVAETARPVGNTLYALMRQLERVKPRICAKCPRYGDEMDHIVPLHLGGSNALANLQWLCVEHHRTKTAQEEKERREGVGFKSKEVSER